MKRAVFLIVAWCAIAVAARGPVPPAPTRWVTDDVGFLTPASKMIVDDQLEAYEKKTGHQVIVWIGAALADNEPINDFAARVFTAWGIGHKHTDDGVVLFIVPATHDLRIEVGYGLEDRLGDLASSHILTEIMVPAIAADKNDEAVQKGVDAILARLDAAGVDKAPVAPPQGTGIAWYYWLLIAIGAIGFIALAIRHPQLVWILLDIIQALGSMSGGSSSSSSGRSSGGGGGSSFSGGGGRSGGGGASAKW